MANRFTYLTRTSSMSSDIKSFYANTNVLITGGAGFFGKMIIQKLLRCNENVNIYLLIRSKRGKSPSDRMEKVYQDPVFQVLRNQDPNFTDKITVMEGDISFVGLGLSDKDRKILTEKVNIVFHCASSMNMDAKMKNIVLSNVRGCREVIELCKEIKHLKSFVIVSTAYSNCPNDIIEEKYYKTSIDPDILVEMNEKFDESILDRMTPSLLGAHPNTYTFSKSMVENMVLKRGKNLPVVLFRPTIVVPTNADPVPGWIDNFYGPAGIVVAVAVGLLRTVYIKESLKADQVPVDLCINALICCAWDGSAKTNASPEDWLVYNYSCGDRYPRTWKLINEQMAKCASYVSKKTLWKYFVVRTSCIYYYKILHVCLHLIPAYIVDAALFIVGKKPILRKVYKKMEKFLSVLQYFMTNEWIIKNDNVYKMWDKLSDKEKAIYPFDLGAIDYYQYYRTYYAGIKLYLLKESLDNQEEELKRYRWLVLMHYSLLTVLSVLFLWVLYKCLVYFF